jgi:Xaa-Pro dipeptidase
VTNFNMPVSESEARITKLQAALQSQSIDGALLVYPLDVYYFSGTRQNATLWIPVDGEPVLMVRKSFQRAKAESLIKNTRPFPGSKEIPEIVGKETRCIGLTYDVLPISYQQYYSGILKGIEFKDISQINRELRAVKSAHEQEALRESGRIFVDVLSQVPSFLKPGMREIDLAAEFECRLRKAGHTKSVRMRAFGHDILGLAVSGAAATDSGCLDGPVVGRGLSEVSPFGASTDVIKLGVPILIDYPGIFNGYIVDATRIFSFGRIDPELERSHKVALDIQQWVVENLRLGAICEDLYLGALRIADEAGLGEHFMGVPGEQVRFVGHGVGLELDEYPVLAKGYRVPLAEGNTVAIEPKFVFPGKGAVGIENTWLVTSSGAENLTRMSDEIVCL